MPTTITPTVGPWVTPLQIPSDGENVSSASVAQYVQEIANRLELIRARVPGLSASGSPIRLLAPPAESFRPSGPEWGLTQATPSNAPAAVTLMVSSVQILFPLDLVAGQVVQGYGCMMRGAAGHAALPAVMPSISLVYIDVTGSGGSDPGFSTANGPVVDPSANTAAYQANHTFGNSGVSHTVVANRQYYLRFTPESSTNALVGLRVISGYVDVSG